MKKPLDVAQDQVCVSGPHKKGKPSVLSAEEMRTLLDSIDVSTLIGLRGRGQGSPADRHHQTQRRLSCRQVSPSQQVPNMVPPAFVKATGPSSGGPDGRAVPARRGKPCDPIGAGSADIHDQPRCSGHRFPRDHVADAGVSRRAFQTNPDGAFQNSVPVEIPAASRAFEDDERDDVDPAFERSVRRRNVCSRF